MEPPKPIHHKTHKHHRKEDGEQKANVAFFIPDDDPDDHLGGGGFHLGVPSFDQPPPSVSHELFCELEELHEGKDGELEWKETARWIKFEEDVEEGGEKWSKPHVASLSLHALFELKKGLSEGTVLLDTPVSNLVQLVDVLLRRWQGENKLDLESGHVQRVGEILLSRHRHQHESHRHVGLHLPHPSFAKKSDSSMSKSNHSLVTRTISTQTQTDDSPPVDVDGKPLERTDTAQSSLSIMAELEQMDRTSSHKMKPNVSFMRHIPKGAEAANILVGTVPFLDQPLVAFVRLEESCCLADITEVAIPTKFVFVILGPGIGEKHFHETGRCMSTLLSDEEFREVAYDVQDKAGLLEGIDHFLDQVIVLPPSEWDPSIRIEPPDKLPKRALSRRSSRPSLTNLSSYDGKSQTEQNGSVPSFQESIDSEEGHGGHADDPALERTGRLFGGFIADIKRKAPWYLSDFTDAFHVQCLASVVYIYIAALTPIVTFGGLLSDATDDYMGAMEGILSGAITGVTFALFAGQPLNIIGATGPMLVFETILFDFCEKTDLDFMSFRFWIGMWSALYLILIVAFDLSALVKYITRFTEESFAALISIIFIYEAIEKVLEIEHDYKVNTHSSDRRFDICSCLPKNDTEDVNMTVTSMSTEAPLPDLFWGSSHWYDFREQCEDRDWELEGDGCDYVPDVFLFSVLTFLGTFVFAYTLKIFKTSPFFPSKVRMLVSDFNVVLAVVIMVIIDWAVGLKTPKLLVPEKFEPTHPDRDWVIKPFEGNPWWTALAGALPALLATILIFMDQQITAVIVNRKENKLVKGVGYHLDLFIIAAQIAACSVLGLPWFVASTVIAVSHVISLRKESEISAPGEKAQFFGIRENRLTALIVSLLIGVSVYLTVVFKNIPKAVLYGVFLYMGVSSLNGLQLVDRVLLLFMPSKYQPDYMYLRHVKTYRVHIFTFIQLVFFGALWAVKGIHSISIAFPLMVLALCFVRKGLECIFSGREIAELDDTLPESHKREKEDKKGKKGSKKRRGSEVHDINMPKPPPEKRLMKRQGSRVQLEAGVVQIPLVGGKVMTVDANKIVYRPDKMDLTPENSQPDLKTIESSTEPERKTDVPMVAPVIQSPEFSNGSAPTGDDAPLEAVSTQL